MNNQKPTYELYNRQSSAINNMAERGLNAFDDYYHVSLQLLNYFKIKNNQGMFIASEIMSEIQRNFQCDLSRLSAALSRYTSFSDASNAYQYDSTENSFDVSLNSKVRVKGFMSKGQPFLYFFRDADEKPTLKIKYLTKEKNPIILIESSSSPEMLCEYKNGSLDESISGIRLDSMQYTILKEGINANRFKYMQTTPVKFSGKDTMFDITQLSDEYLAFYIFMLKQQKNNQHNLYADGLHTLPITSENAEVLFNNYYDVVKSIVEPQAEFSLSDLLMIMSSIKDEPGTQIADYMPLDKTSEIVKKICSLKVQDDAAIEGEQVSLREIDASGKSRFYSVAKRKGDMTIDILDASRNVVCKYLFIPTKEGFSIIRNLPSNARTNNPNEIVAFSITLSDNDLKFIAYSGKKPASYSKPDDRAVDINLKLESGGKFTLKKYDSFLAENSTMAMQEALENMKSI